MDYTKQQKINAICEQRGFTGTNAEKLAFIQETVAPEVDAQLTQQRTRIQEQITTLQEELAKIPATPLQALNKRAIMILRAKETKTLTDNLGEL